MKKFIAAASLFVLIGLLLLPVDSTAATISFRHPTEPDGDADGIPDSTDNSPANPNPYQEDSDGDGIGDFGDSDPDNPDPAAGGIDSDADEIPDNTDPHPSVPYSTWIFDANGPYTVTPGTDVDVLFTTTGADPVHFAVEVDVDADGVDASWKGSAHAGQFTMTWADLQDLGLDSGTHSVEFTAIAGDYQFRNQHTATFTQVPEPTSFWLLLTALGIAFGWRRRERR